MITSEFLKDKLDKKIYPYVYAGLPLDFKLLDDVEMKVARAVEEVTGVRAEHYLNDNSRDRIKEHVDARRLFFFVLTKKFKIKVSGVAAKFGFNHATLLHHNRKVQEYVEMYPDYKMKVNRVYDRVAN